MFLSGELVGVQYLYSQTGQEFPSRDQTRQQLEEEEDDGDQLEMDDEGFVEETDQPTPLNQPTQPDHPTPGTPEQVPILQIPTEMEYQEMAMEGTEHQFPFFLLCL